MRLAIMQPYFFPYIGYFQLLAAVDRFVMYDDVAYMKGGWVNRNRWLVGGKPAHFTVPVRDASSFRTIAETQVAAVGWAAKLEKTFSQSYSRAPFRQAAASLLRMTVSLDERSIARLAAASIRAVADYLGIRTPIVDTSAVYGNAGLRSAARVLDICRQERATTYINPIGGIQLYDAGEFAAHGVQLWFLRPESRSYPQLAESFTPFLSILDVIAFNPPDVIRGMLAGYELT